MKRVVSSSFITLFIILVIAAAFFYFRNLRNAGGDPVSAVPADAAFFLSFDANSDKLKTLLQLDYRKTLSKAPAIDSLFHRLSFIDSLSESNDKFHSFLASSPLIISSHVTGAGTFDFLFLKSNEGNTSFQELIKEIAGDDQKRNYDGINIYEIQVSNNRVFSYSIAKGVIIGSFTPFLVEDAIRQLKIGKPVTGTFTNLSNEAMPGGLEIFVNFNNLPTWLNVFTSQNAAAYIRTFSTWAAAGIRAGKSSIVFEGNLADRDTTHSSFFIQGQEPVAKKLIEILPRKTAFINYYGVSDFETYYKKLYDGSSKNLSHAKGVKLLSDIQRNYKFRIEEKMIEWIGNEYALIITEPPGTEFNNHTFAVFHQKEKGTGLSALKTISRIIDKKDNNRTMEENYNGHTIGLVRLTGVLPAMFGESFDRVQKMYYTSINNYIVFGNQASSLRNIIDDHKAGSLLIKTDAFKESSKDIPAKANRFIYCKPSLSLYLFKYFANASWKSRIDKYKDVISGITSFTFQVMQENGKNKFNASLNFTRIKSEEGISQLFAVSADSSITVKPLLTTDPGSQSRQILFQDDFGNLILTDNNGNVVWKEPVDGKILSEIYETDLFKNNSRQFIFNTEKYLYMLDTDGKPVGNYPIRLPADATNGLAAFDFDKNRDTKIYIACANRRIYAYTTSGRPLPGWSFQTATGTITDPVLNVKINDRDFLLINDRESGAKIINRYGETGLNLSQSCILAKNSGVYNDSTGGLVLSDPFGSIVKINESGIVEIIPLNIAGPDHGFLYADADKDGEKDFIFADGKELTAYNKNLAMIYRKVFEDEITGRIYPVMLTENEKGMAIQSQQANKTWILRHDGSVYPGFPVKGNGPLVVDEINLDGNKNLVTGSTDGNLYVYRLD